MIGTKVFVYFNLHKKVFSVKAMEGRNKGRVIAHAATVTLANGITKVSAAGRARVLAEKVKNVHAGVQGQLTGLGEDATFDFSEAQAITYNPYRFETFVYVADTTRPAVAFTTCILQDKKVFINT